MKTIISRLKGDKVIWALVALLSLFSFMPVFSASSNLAYVGQGTGNTFGYLIKHLVHILIGFGFIFYVHKVPFNYHKKISWFLLPLIWILLLYTMFFGVEIGSAKRWVEVVGISFQPSTAAFLILMVFVARYLAKERLEAITFKSSILELWTPVGITLLLILPANFSTAAFMFVMVIMLVFIGKYPLKYLSLILLFGVMFFASFVGTAKLFKAVNPDNVPSLFQRVETWEKRITRFTDDNIQDPDEVYQIERAKTAIATGGIYGLGPGKSVQKNFLPQSSSDFIFAIIVEEFGLVGGVVILGVYLLLLFRLVVASHKSSTMFGKLLVIGLGFPIVFQAFVNMGVAVELLPTTGQTLPLISSGGSSIWVTCISIAIILNVTKKDEEIAEEIADNEKREVALQKLIDKQLEEDAKEDSEELEEEVNPINAVLNK